MRTGPKILLLAMPDVAMAFKRIGDMPNLGLASLAASVPGADVRIMDLHVVFKDVRRRLIEELKAFQPDLVGFSSMSFQFNSALKLAETVRENNPATPLVLGGYHASMAYAGFGEREAERFDFLIRGEAETPFRLLVDELASGGRNFSGIPSLSYQDPGWVHNPPGRLENLDELPLPRLEARIVDGFTIFGKRIETVETSRGCTYPCNFCSISKMYGPSFRAFSIDRVIEDLERRRARGAEMVFFVDDNITLDVPRFKRLCEAIIGRGLNNIEYITQVSASGMAKDPELARLMAEAGFGIIFMGVENVSPKQLKQLKKGVTINAAAKAIALCREHGISIIGGFITGLPDDGPEDVRHLFAQARVMGIDHIIVQCVTPYPNTEMRENLIADGLVTNKDDYSLYNGYVCNVRTRKMSAEKLNRLLQWEYMKLYFDPRYIRANRMLQRENSRRWKQRVFINSLEHLPAYFTNRLFVSRHSL